MKCLVTLFLGILCAIFSPQVFAASDELKSLFDKTAALIDTLDDARFPANRLWMRFIGDPSDRLDCRRTLLRLQIYTGDSEGADQSIVNIQKEIEALEDTKRQNEFRLFLTEALSRLYRYSDAIEVMSQIDDTATKTQASITIADLFFDDKSATDIDIEPIITSALAESVSGNFPDKEAILAALHGILLAQMDRTDEAKTRFTQAYDAIARAVKLAEQNAQLLDKRTHPSGAVSIRVPEGITLWDKERVEQRLLAEVIRYQTIAGLQDDAFDVYRNYTFLNESLNDNPWNRFALMDRIVRTLVERGEIDAAIEMVKQDDKMEDASAPSMLIAYALANEGRIKEMFDLLDIPQFQGPQATGGIIWTALGAIFGANSPEIAEQIIAQMERRFPAPEMEFDKMLRAATSSKLVAEGKWDEAIAMTKTFETEGRDDFMFPTTQSGVLRGLAYSEWQKGNFDRANEAISLIQTEQMRKQIADLRDQFNAAIKIEDLRRRSQTLREISHQQFSLLDFDGQHQTAMARLDAIDMTGDPRDVPGEIAGVLFTSIRAQQLDAGRGDEILERGWKMMLDVDGANHLDRIQAMLHNNRNRRALFKVADFALQTEAVADQVIALLIIAREIAMIEMEHKPMTRHDGDGWAP